ncbi:TIGR03435 family protein [Granulicella paludicola]|jgi:uncharacterized protein (TIGR03435 family)|uniref:TIGR03435 family protein n=1 Tax=Granulicella paludicola TaxID=474951 RepID=UPI0021E0797A|nr:TIGR03435 family protein [Granulicella paludicola]
MIRLLCFAGLLLTTVVSTSNVQAQTGHTFALLPSAVPTKPPMEWDTISIHKHDPNDTNMRWGSNPDGFGGTGVTLRTLISQAYGFTAPELRDDELIGLPGWAKDARYDVAAKVSYEDAPAWKKIDDMSMEETIQHLLSHDPTPDMLMMRSLLEERFGLKVHYETRTEPIYELVIDKGGSKLKPAADPKHGNINWNAGLMKGDGIPIPFLAMVLSVPLQRSVLDHTGLDGHFDFELHFLPANTPPNTDSNDPDLLTAVREQLGLRLTSSKGPVLVVVVDSLHEPTPN